METKVEMKAFWSDDDYGFFGLPALKPAIPSHFDFSLRSGNLVAGVFQLPRVQIKSSLISAAD